MDDKELMDVGEKIVKQKRPKRSEQLQVQTDPGDNTQYLTNALELYSLPPIDTNDGGQVKERIEEYFRIMAKNDMKPSVSGMALALGVDRRTLWTWVSGKTGRKPEVLDTIKKAYDILNLMMEDYMQNGKINPVSGIFLMKNNFGYADKQEVVVTPNVPLGEQKDDEELRKSYLESIPEELPENAEG